MKPGRHSTAMVARLIRVLLEEVFMSKQKIVPSLGLDKEAEEAARLYTSLFKNSPHHVLG